MSSVVLNVVLIFVFMIIGGIFSAAEMSLVSLRESQLKQISHKGARGKTLAALAANPNRFLSAVQIGVTIAGFLGSSFGGATLAPYISRLLVGWGLSAQAADTIALIVITLIVAYFSIVISELTAKRLAMQRAESFALALGPMVSGIAKALRPIIWLLDLSTNALVRLLGGDPKRDREEVTDEEIRAMVSSAGSLGAEERAIMDDVFAAGDSSLREVMVPRTEVDFLPGDMPAYRAMREVQNAAHSRYPVMNGSADNVIGFLHIRDLMDLEAGDRHTPIAQLARPIMHLPDSVLVLKAMTMMRKQSQHIAVVLDEYGGTAGIITLEDILEEIIGDITDEYDEEAAPLTLASLDGLTTIEEFEEIAGYTVPEGPYDTLAGYLMAELGKLPKVGDYVDVELANARDLDAPAGRFRLSVTELDRRRVARVAAKKL
ncbi:MAG: hemolysin family protein [Propionibacteriaceae bacterium]